jgi:hypothetical protein
MFILFYLFGAEFSFEILDLFFQIVFLLLPRRLQFGKSFFVLLLHLRSGWRVKEREDVMALCIRNIPQAVARQL